MHSLMFERGNEWLADVGRREGENPRHAGRPSLRCHKRTVQISRRTALRVFAARDAFAILMIRQMARDPAWRRLGERERGRGEFG